MIILRAVPMVRARIWTRREFGKMWKPVRPASAVRQRHLTRVVVRPWKAVMLCRQRRGLWA